MAKINSDGAPLGSGFGLGHRDSRHVARPCVWSCWHGWRSLAFGKIRQFPPSAKKRPPFRVFLPILHLFEPVSRRICITVLRFTKMSYFGVLKFQRFGGVTFCCFFYIVVFFSSESLGIHETPLYRGNLRVNAIFRSGSCVLHKHFFRSGSCVLHKRGFHPAGACPPLSEACARKIQFLACEVVDAVKQQHTVVVRRQFFDVSAVIAGVYHRYLVVVVHEIRHKRICK